MFEREDPLHLTGSTGWRRLSLLLLGLCLGLGCSRPKTGTSDGPARETKEVTASPPEEHSPELGAAPPEAGPGPSGSKFQEISGEGILEHIAKSDARFTLLNFWASWCGPCRREFPMLVALQDNLRSRGVEILFVSLDEAESVPVAVEFVEQNGVSGPIWVGERPIGAIKRAIHPRWPGMLPATFLFDSEAKLQHFWGGPVYEHELLPVVEAALKGENVQGETQFGLQAGKDLRQQ